MSLFQSRLAFFYWLAVAAGVLLPSMARAALVVPPGASIYIDGRGFQEDLLLRNPDNRLVVDPAQQGIFSARGVRPEGTDYDFLYGFNLYTGGVYIGDVYDVVTYRVTKEYKDFHNGEADNKERAANLVSQEMTNYLLLFGQNVSQLYRDIENLLFDIRLDEPRDYYEQLVDSAGNVGTSGITTIGANVALTAMYGALQYDAYRHRTIANDPPDPDFENFPSSSSLAVESFGLGAVGDAYVSDLIQTLFGLSEALDFSLTSLERAEGAIAAGRGELATAHFDNNAMFNLTYADYSEIAGEYLLGLPALLEFLGEDDILVTLDDGTVVSFWQLFRDLGTALGGDTARSFQAEVPLPASLPLFLIGAAGLFGFKIRSGSCVRRPPLTCH